MGGSGGGRGCFVGLLLEFLVTIFTCSDAVLSQRRHQHRAVGSTSAHQPASRCVQGMVHVWLSVLFEQSESAAGRGFDGTCKFKRMACRRSDLRLRSSDYAYGSDHADAGGNSCAALKYGYHDVPGRRKRCFSTVTCTKDKCWSAVARLLSMNG